MMEAGHTHTRPGFSSRPIISADAPRDELLARVRQLEAVLFSTRWVPAAWRLTVQEECTLVAIVEANRPVPVRALYNALFGLRVDGGPDESIVRVIVTRLRRKLRPFGISIPSLKKAAHGSGYYLTPESRLVVDALRNGAAT